MVAELKWSDQAKDDIQSIHDFISVESPRAAIAYVDGITQACGRLSLFPESGRAYNEHYRVVVVRNHLAFYRYDSALAEVTVVTIMDGRRDLREFFGDR